MLNPRDQTHDIAIRVSKDLRGYRIFTTEEVLTELLTDFGASGPYLRSAAPELVKRIQTDGSIQVLPQTREGFLAGLRLYQARPDNGYSMTDASSMEVMRREGLGAALTNDEYFKQEGFVCLLDG